MGRIVASTLALSLLVAGNGGPADAGVLTSAGWSIADSTAMTPSNYSWSATTTTADSLASTSFTVPAGTTATTGRHLSLPGTTGNYASTPDVAGNALNGDLDIRAKVSLDDWTPATESVIVGKWVGTNDRTFRMYVSATGRLNLQWSKFGYCGSCFVVSSNTLGFSDGSAQWVRVTRQLRVPSNSWYTANFYTSTDGVEWTLLTNVPTNSGTYQEAFDSTSPIEIGSDHGGTESRLAGEVHHLEVRGSVNGSVVSKFDPGEATAPFRSWTSSVSDTWTVNQTSTSAQAGLANLSAILGHRLTQRG